MKIPRSLFVLLGLVAIVALGFCFLGQHYGLKAAIAAFLALTLLVSPGASRELCMAATTRGTALLKWGTIALATYVVQAVDLDKTTESHEVWDEDGQALSEVETFGMIDNLQLTVIPISTATEPALGATITYNTVKYSLKGFKKVNNIKQPEMWTLTCRRLIGITYT